MPIPSIIPETERPDPRPNISDETENRPIPERESLSRFRPRVLFVSSSSGDGGADRLPIELARALSQREAEVLFACRAGQFIHERSRAAGIETIPFNIRNSGDFSAAWQIAGLVADRRIDILHVHARRDFMVAIFAAWLSEPVCRRMGFPRPRVVLHSHLIRPLGKPYRAAGWFFQAGADAVIAVSTATEAYLNQVHGLRPGFVQRITNGVDMSAYVEANSELSRRMRISLRREWGIGDSDVAIGMVGRLYQKGQTTLLAAVAQIASRHPDMKVVLVGPERDPGDAERIREMAARFGIVGRLVLAGARDDIPVCMAAFDIFAHLPRDEAFGLVLAEAMASGLPVVATDAGGCREVIGEFGRGGRLLAAGSLSALIETLVPLLEPGIGADLRSARGAESRRAAEEFSRSRQIDDILALYFRLCSGRTAKTSFRARPGRGVKPEYLS